ncbi:MAG: hypothetical protein ACE5M4_09835 [Anaerolineales bacterium]
MAELTPTPPLTRHPFPSPPRRGEGDEGWGEVPDANLEGDEAMAERTIGDNRIEGSVKILLQAAMVIFLVNVLVGMLNGLDLVEFDRKALLTHVHAGTLGWITLGFLAACLWLFAERGTLTGWRPWSPRWLSSGGILYIALYVAAFYSGDLTARLVGGVLTLLAMLAYTIRLQTIGELAIPL